MCVEVWFLNVVVDSVIQLSDLFLLNLNLNPINSNYMQCNVTVSCQSVSAVTLENLKLSPSWDSYWLTGIDISVLTQKADRVCIESLTLEKKKSCRQPQELSFTGPNNTWLTLIFKPNKSERQTLICSYVSFSSYIF